MAVTILFDGNRFRAASGFADKDGLKACGFRWDSSSYAWVTPDASTVSRYLARYPETKLHHSAARLVIADNERVRVRAELATMDDTEGPSFLYPYQRVGVRWLANGSVILSDALGLGKTPQTICAADEVGATRVLVIAPKSLLYQWTREIEKFSRGSSYIMSRVGDIPDGVRWVVTNYETVAPRLQRLKAWAPEVLIVDEAVRIKNRKAQRTQKLWELAASAGVVWLITGTPIRNRPAEIWSLLRTLDPDTFQNDRSSDPDEGGFWRFARTYCDVYDNGYGLEVGDLKPEAVDDFRRMLAPYLLRREKSLLKLPPLSREEIRLPMTEKQARAYSKAEDGILLLAPDDLQEDIPNMLSQLTRLRQIATDPSLCGAPGESAKTEWLTDFLDGEGQGHKVIAFCPYASYLHKLKELFGPRVAIVTGSISGKDRETYLAEFRDNPDCQVLLMSEAGVEGLNLQVADVVVWLSLPWTPDTLEQGTARAWRHGQEKEVHEILLLHDDSIDEDMRRVLTRKEKVANQALALREVLLELRERRGVDEAEQASN